MPPIQTTFNRWDVIGGAPRLVDDGFGNPVINGPIIPIEVTATTPVSDGNLVIRNNVLARGDGVTLGANLLSYYGNTDALILIPKGKTDVENAANARAAKLAAASLTPGGNALSATNRAAVVALSGRYDFGLGDGSNHGYERNTEFVDLIGFGPPESVVFTSQIATASRGTIEQTANDSYIANITIEHTPASAVGSGDTKPAAFFPTSNLPLNRLHNVIFRTGSDTNGLATRQSITYSGRYTDVDIVGNYAQVFANATLSGTFINCGRRSVRDSWNSISGMMHTGSTLSGTFVNCEITNILITSILSGTMIRCDCFSPGVITGSAGMNVATGAVMRHCGFRTTGSGYLSLVAASAATVEISNCYTPQGIGPNITNSNPHEGTSTTVVITPAATDLTVADGVLTISIPDSTHGRRLRSAVFEVDVAGTTNASTFQVARVRSGTPNNMLSTVASIASGAKTSTGAVVDSTYSLLNSSTDRLRFDIKSLSTTAPKGLQVKLRFY